MFDFITGLLRPLGTYLLGRRLHETMSFWDAPVETYPPEQRDFASEWQRCKKIVFSRTPANGVAFDPEAIVKLKRESKLDIGIGGAELARLAIDAGLVDECHVFLHSAFVGRGKPAFGGGLRRKLEPIDAERFGNVVHVHYRIGDRLLRETS